MNKSFLLITTFICSACGTAQTNEQIIQVCRDFCQAAGLKNSFKTMLADVEEFNGRKVSATYYSDECMFFINVSSMSVYLFMNQKVLYSREVPKSDLTRFYRNEQDIWTRGDNLVSVLAKAPNLVRDRYSITDKTGKGDPALFSTVNIVYVANAFGFENAGGNSFAVNLDIHTGEIIYFQQGFDAVYEAPNVKLTAIQAMAIAHVRPEFRKGVQAHLQYDTVNVMDPDYLKKPANHHFRLYYMITTDAGYFTFVDAETGQIQPPSMEGIPKGSPPPKVAKAKQTKSKNVAIVRFWKDSKNKPGTKLPHPQKPIPLKKKK